MFWLTWFVLALADTPPEPLEDFEPIVGIEAGDVILDVVVNGRGVAIDVTVVQASGDELTDRAAVQAVLMARYQPALDNELIPFKSVLRQQLTVVPGALEDRPDLTPDALPEGVEEMVVVGTAEQQVGERIVTLDDIKYLPGGAGDVVRAVQNLPGIARPPFNLGQLLIRGTAPEDSAYYLDGVRIPIVFHFGGLSTVINADSLHDVRFLPGGYGVRYGRQLGGVVDLRTTEELPKEGRAYASMDLFQATAFAELKKKKTAVTLSARRSYIDTIAEPFINSAVEETVRAPRYFDFQGRVLHRPNDADLFDALVLFSDDVFRVLGDEDEVLIDLGITFAKGRLRWARRGSGPWRGEVSLLGGPEVQQFVVEPDGIAFERGTTANLRGEVERMRRDDPAGLVLGTGVEFESLKWAFDIPTFGSPDEGAASAISAGTYGDITLGMDPFEIITGARLDTRWAGPAWATSFDPRTTLRVAATPTTDLEATAGSYSQFATLRQVELEGGLAPERALQLTAGMAQDLGGSWDLKVTVFESQLTQLVVGRQDAFEFFTTPPAPGPEDTGDWANDGTGRVDGLEIHLRTRGDRTVGWIAATFSRSVRTDRPDQDPHPFAFDQPINAVALASRELPKDWRIGGRVRFALGIPYTQIVNRIYDLEQRRWIPLFGEAYAARLNPYLAADIRFDKQWTFKRWSLSTYLDITNVTNRSNQELMTFSPDLDEERPITGLPIVPAFGIRGDF